MLFYPGLNICVIFMQILKKPLISTLILILMKVSEFNLSHYIHTQSNLKLSERNLSLGIDFDFMCRDPPQAI